MPLNFQQYNFIGNNFAIGGLNLKSAVTNLADNESPNCRNVIFDTTGSIRKRRGFLKLNAQAIAGSPTITGIFQLQRSDGSECVIIGAGTDIYQDVTSPISILSGQTSGALYDFAALNDYAIIVNGADANRKFDCSTVTELGIDPPAVGAFAATEGVAGAIPNGTYQYVVTFVNGDGRESNPTTPISVSVVGGPSVVDLTGIPVSSDPQVVDRNIYRTFAGGARFFFVQSVGDNVATVDLDNTPDSGLGAEVEFDNDKPPIFKYIETHKNRSFGVEAANPNRVRFSKDSNESAYPALNFIDVSPDDGDIITGIISYFDLLVIFKRESIYVLTGNDEFDFVLRRAQTDTRVGTVSTRTAVVLGNMVIFLSERGVYAFDGVRTHYLSSKIEAIWDKAAANQPRTFNWSQEGITAAVSYKAKSRTWYWLTIPTGASLQNDTTLIYDSELKNWTLFDGIFANSLAIVEESNEPVLYSGDYLGFMWKQDQTDNDGFSHFPSFSTSNANTPTTLEDASQVFIDSTATGGAAFTLIDATQTMIVNEHIGRQIYISAGTGAGQSRTIISNTPTSFTVSVAWTTIPDATSVYQVGGFPIDQLIGVRVKILSGLGEGQIRTITDNEAKTFTIGSAWDIIPDTTSEYSIGFIEAEWESRWFHYNQPENVKRLRYIHVNADREGDYDIDVGLRYDFFLGDANTFTQQLALAGIDSVWDVSIWDVDFWDQVSQLITRLSNQSSRIHRYVQIEFSNDAGDQPFNINSFNYLYQIKGIRR